MKHIKTQHPKQSIMMDRIDLQAKLLDRGWIGQAKMNGVRAQVHVGKDCIRAEWPTADWPVSGCYGRRSIETFYAW